MEIQYYVNQIKLKQNEGGITLEKWKMFLAVAALTKYKQKIGF